jgi:arylsulfatase A-like enzyme
MRRAAEWLQQNKPGIVLLPWLALAISALALKYSLLRVGGFHESAICLRSSGILNHWETLSLFRADLLYCGVVVPLLGVVLTRPLPLFWRVASVTLVSVVATAVLNLETAVYQATGAFTSLQMMWIAISWAVHSHDRSIIALPVRVEFEIAAWILCVALFALLALIALRKDIRWLNYAGIAAFAVAAAATVAAYTPRVPAMAWTPPLLGRALSSAVFESDASVKTLSRSAPELLREYRQTSHVPPPQTSAFTAKAKNYNVLFFVMESMSAAAFDPARDSLLDMPNARRLREHSFLGARHYTSFPLTDYATFSIFTSLYQRCNAGVVIGDRDVRLPGIIRSLRNAGYATGFYGYVWKIPLQRDDRMLKSMGFEKIVEPSIDPERDREGLSTFYGPIDYVAAHDLQSLQSLRQDIRQWTHARQPFAAAYFPEIGHDPYRDFNGHASKTEMERGHALAVRQDEWLGELVDELQQDGALDHTIIVITGDHGMRYLPNLPGQPVQLQAHGKLDDVVLRVPLLIYVPKVLEHPVRIDEPTSHIDIAPTLLDLEGITAERNLEQGASLANPANLAGRRLFLPMDIFGATGFFYRGNYYMRNSSDTVFKSSTLRFDDGDVLPFAGTEAEEARQLLAAQAALQRALLSHVLEDRVR